MCSKNNRSHRWAIVLAAGDGTRVSGLTRSVSGQRVPKQFWSDEDESLLRRAIARADRVVPREHIVVVVAASHERWWHTELDRVLPTENIVVQPRNRGTAAGILLPLSKILRGDPSARVAILPSDHAAVHEWTLASAIEEAFGAVDNDPDRLVLLGMAMRRADTGFGWILPGARALAASPRQRSVKTFVEKPSSSDAARLQRLGGLVSSFVTVADGRRLRGLFDRTLPHLGASFRRLGLERTSVADDKLAALYETLPAYDFSADVLVPAVDQLDVLRVPPCGWTDLGTPQRVRAWIAKDREPFRRTRHRGPRAHPTQPLRATLCASRPV